MLPLIHNQTVKYMTPKEKEKEKMIKYCSELAYLIKYNDLVEAITLTEILQYILNKHYDELERNKNHAKEG